MMCFGLNSGLDVAHDHKPPFPNQEFLLSSSLCGQSARCVNFPFRPHFLEKIQFIRLSTVCKTAGAAVSASPRYERIATEVDAIKDACCRALIGFKRTAIVFLNNSSVACPL